MRYITRAIVATVIAVGTLIGLSGIASADLLATHQCPAGYTGVIVEADGHFVQVCQNIKP